MGEKRRIELLCPAGDPEKLQMALTFGADAVYLAGNSFGMRAAAGNFDRTQLTDAAALCKRQNVALHVTCNTLPRDTELSALPEYLEFLDSLRVDALIVADLGVFRLAQQYAPHIPLHVSTQAGVVNTADAKAWQDLGAKRVILARELSLDEIRTLRQNTDKSLEIEAFVHGSMCVSYSGRCLLSEYMVGRDANRGACAQPCRYQYALVEEKRPGQYYPIREEDGETFLLNSNDMCMIDHLPELLEAGLDSLKIEGRGKSAYYAASTTAAYRGALDQVLRGEPVSPLWREETEKTSHRPFSTGFYLGTPGQYTQSSRYIQDYQVVAAVASCDENGYALVDLRNKFSLGDTLEILAPSLLPVTFTVATLQSAEGEPLDVARNLNLQFGITLPLQVPPGSLLRRAVDPTT
ncbi:MAG: U32 family peptidase [Oscillospiraceae bacterium]